MKQRHKKRHNHRIIVRNVAKRLRTEAAEQLIGYRVAIGHYSRVISTREVYTPEALRDFKVYRSEKRQGAKRVFLYLQMSDKRLYKQWRSGDWVDDLYTH